MWAQAAFVLPILNGLTGVTGHAVLAVFVLALALAQLALTNGGAAGNGGTASAATLASSNSFAAEWEAEPTSRDLA